MQRKGNAFNTKLIAPLRKRLFFICKNKLETTMSSLVSVWPFSKKIISFYLFEMFVFWKEFNLGLLERKNFEFIFKQDTLI